MISPEFPPYGEPPQLPVRAARKHDTQYVHCTLPPSAKVKFWGNSEIPGQFRDRLRNSPPPPDIGSLGNLPHHFAPENL